MEYHPLRGGGRLGDGLRRGEEGRRGKGKEGTQRRGGKRKEGKEGRGKEGGGGKCEWYMQLQRALILTNQRHRKLSFVQFLHPLKLSLTAVRENRQLPVTFTSDTPPVSCAQFLN